MYSPKFENLNNSGNSVSRFEITSQLELPIEKYRTEIIQKINENPVTIITAETGAGKSTQVPQYLLEEGYRVIVTQPRRLAARSVAARVAQERKQTLGEEIGFRTAFEKQDSPSTKLLFCTDGLQLVRELTGQGAKGKKMVLVLDEVHEWNINMETLVAWTKKQQESGEEFKIVLMSATLDSQKLAVFFNNNEQPAPLIDVPGKLYPIEERQVGSKDLIKNTAELTNQGRNVLVFQPGKKEIDETITELKKLNLDAEILPLHGQLEPADQQKVFKHYGRPKIIVSTNVAQTSITIDDIDAVVDSGTERIVETKDGVEGLYLKNTSQADCQQRKGRSGRCRPGIYVLCSDQNISDRQQFPRPEIQRVRLDQMVLRLAASGLDATELNFFHQPDRSVLTEAKRALMALGAIDHTGLVTKIGEQIAKLPIDVHTARMVIEAEKNHCVDDVLTIAACLESGGLRDKTDKWQALTSEVKSDVLAELDLYRQARHMSNTEMQTNGIFAKSFFRSREIRQHLSDGVRRAGLEFKNKNNENNREAILKSVAAGMIDNLYHNNYGNEYKKNEETRLLGKESVVKNNPEWIVAIPRDIEFKNRRGYMQILSLLTMCSEIDPNWLIEIAPQLVEKRRRYPRWSSTDGFVSEEEYTIFNGNEVKKEAVMAEINETTILTFYQALLSGQIQNEVAQEIYQHNQKIKKEAEELWIRSGGVFEKFTSGDEIAIYKKALDKYQITTSVVFNEVVPNKINPNQLKINLDQIITSADRAQIEKDNPLQISLGGKLFEVKYSQDYSSFLATITVDLDDVANINSAELETALPSGRQLTLSLDDKNYPDIKTNDINIMRKKIEYYRLQRAWKNFIEKHPDEIIQTEAGIALPDLSEALVYDEETKKLAYPGYYYSWGTFYKKWYDSADSAEQNTKNAIENKKVKDIELYRNQCNDMIISINRSLDRNQLLKEDYEQICLSINTVREQLNQGDHTASPFNQLITSLNKIKKDLEQAQNKYQQFTQDNNETLQQKIKNKEILIDFICRHRRLGMSANNDGWVIRPDGSLRYADNCTNPQASFKGDYHWKMVEENELALEWSCQTIRDIEGSSHFAVRKLPVNGLTTEQLKTIAEIESEIETLKGSFGLDPEINEYKEKLIKTIVDQVTIINGQRVNLSPNSLHYPAICGKNGINMNEFIEASKFYSRNRPFSETCEDRDAQLVARLPILDGFLELVIYDKWGNLNINMRFKKSADYPELSLTENEETIENKEGTLAIELENALNHGSSRISETKISKTINISPEKNASSTVNQPKPEKIQSIKSLTEMTQDEIFEEYENNDRQINKIINANPDLDLLFQHLNDAEQELLETEERISQYINKRDLISKINQKEKITEYITQLRENKQSIKQNIKNLKQKASEIKDAYNKIKNLRLRQEQIEKLL